MYKTVHSEKKIVIFVSNTLLDGFREGDGDLMDKLAAELNHVPHIQAVRIIEHPINIPDDKQDLESEGQLICLLTEQEKKHGKEHVLQEKFINILNHEKYANMQKIVYIGSRLRATEMKDKAGHTTVSFGESGSLFTQTFIQQLKTLEIKIVVCALEFQFFKRSFEDLERCYYTLQEHFFEADNIHFLTQPDKENFEYTLEELKKTSYLKIDQRLLDWYPTQVEKLNTYIDSLEKTLKKEKFLKGRGAHESVDTLETDTATDKEYFYLLKKIKGERQEELNQLTAFVPESEEIKNELNVKINTLKKSMKLERLHSEVLGIFKEKKKQSIRALEKLQTAYKKASHYQFFLSPEALEHHKQKSTFISGIYTVSPLTAKEILGRQSHHKQELIQALTNRPSHILHFGLIRGEKGIDEALELALLLQEKQLDCKVIIAGKLFVDLMMVARIFKKIFHLDNPTFYEALGQALQEKNLTGDVLNLARLCKDFKQVERRITEEKKVATFNTFCTDLYNTMKQKFPDKVKYVDVLFNVTEDKLREVAMECKYAIKFDNKGMANNASTIVSCLGLYLPTFTTRGIVTNTEFVNAELSQRTLETQGKYSGVVIMPEEEYVVHDTGDIRPKNPSMLQVLAFIQNEKQDVYTQRIETLHQLHEDKLFDCAHTVEQLAEHIFFPLLSEKAPSQSPSSVEHPSPRLDNSSLNM